MLNKIILKKDHYEIDYVLEFKNCEIVYTDSECVFIKVNEIILKKIIELKKDIVKIINRNSEFYCDCKKIIKLKNTFEEVIKVDKNEIEVTNCKCDVSLMIYKIWFSKCSYGPMLKLTKLTNLNESVISFLPNPEDTDSDEEINHHYVLKKKGLKV